ncbi:MAG: hypothetical protein PVH80_05410, partial [Anaerolineae bacterium]
LGCALADASIEWSAWQAFQGGAMLWRRDTEGITIYYEDGTWTELPDEWDQESAIPSRGSPPPGKFHPQRGFGYAWGSRDELFERLAWALEREKGFCAKIQQFDLGVILQSSTVETCLADLFNWATHPDFNHVFLSIYNDGTYSDLFDE